MMSMTFEIQEYDNSDKDKVCSLFNTIYKDGGEQANRVISAYSRNSERHITTKIAVLGNNKIVGQANMWLSRNSTDSATIGYHVHPDNRRKGIATALCRAAMQEAEAAGLKKIYILTYRDNEPSIAVARNLGFEPVSIDLNDKNIIGFVKFIK